MKQVVAKRLHKQAQRETVGKEDKGLIAMAIRRFKTGKTGSDGKEVIITKTGGLRHKEGTTRRVYKKLKKAYMGL